MLEYMYSSICLAHRCCLYFKKSPPPVFPRIPCFFSQHACRLQGERGGAKMSEVTWQKCLIFLFPLCTSLSIIYHHSASPHFFSVYIHSSLWEQISSLRRRDGVLRSSAYVRFNTLLLVSGVILGTKSFHRFPIQKPDSSTWSDHNDK